MLAEIPAGAYMDDHAHETESIIYTVHGQWVLCSRGQRWHMRTGSLFWFGDGIPTGYGSPVTETAYILIFKAGERTPGYNAAMLERVCEIARSSTRSTPQARRSCPRLPDEHPAKVFARELGQEP